MLFHKSDCISGYKSQKVVGEKLRQAHLFSYNKDDFPLTHIIMGISQEFLDTVQVQ